MAQKDGTMDGEKRVSVFSTIDDWTVAVYVEVEHRHIVLIKNLLDSYDGIVTTRTHDKVGGVLSIFSTPPLAEEATRVLDGLKSVIPWRLSRESP